MELCREVDKAVKVRIYPSYEQRLMFQENISHARFVFNKVKETCEYTYRIIKEHGSKPRNLINRKFTNQILTNLKHSTPFFV
jgi:hypothetical protein